MSLQLLLLRHAKSSWSDATLPDHDRPLNDRGRRAASRMGRVTREIDRLPGLVLSSDSRRTRETVDLWCSTAAWDGPIRWRRDLYHASVETLAEIATSIEDASRIMLVAHNPGIEAFATRLAGTDVPMPTATLAVFESTASRWRDLLESPCRTVGVWRPRDLTDPSADATPSRR